MKADLKGTLRNDQKQTLTTALEIEALIASGDYDSALRQRND